MTITPEQIALARMFEPVLYLASTFEHFLPADPKVYLENASLWRVRPPGTTPDEWGEEAAGEWPKTPIREPKKVAALKSEAHGDVTWLGDLLPSAASGEDRFLSVSGWPESNYPEQGAENRFADLSALRDYYRERPYVDSQPWYYAEILDHSAMTALASDPPPGMTNAMVEALIGLLDEPTLILYHLFFPGHEEGLDGCGPVGDGATFGNFAGDWGCVAVLLERGRPTYVGLSQRNVGVRSATDDATRLSMAVSSWFKVSTQTGFENHPQVAVSSGTHSLYLDLASSGSLPPPSSTSAYPEVGTVSCGEVEKADGVDATEPPGSQPPDNPSDVIIVLKALIPIVGAIWAGIECSDPFGRSWETTPPRDAVPTGTDHGTVIAPAGMLTGSAKHWQTEGVLKPSDFRKDDTGRVYPFVVDRTEQVWWASGDGVGYHGRWGPAVATDPFGRRSGMRGPNFAKMFIAGLALS